MGSLALVPKQGCLSGDPVQAGKFAVSAENELVKKTLTWGFSLDTHTCTSSCHTVDTRDLVIRI
jgi:hypothetical protein